MKIWPRSEMFARGRPELVVLGFLRELQLLVAFDLPQQELPRTLGRAQESHLGCVAQHCLGEAR